MSKKGKGGGGAARSEIHDAIESGDAVKVSEILAGDASKILVKNKDGWQPLHTAAFNGEEEIVKILLGAGADKNARCSDGDTAVHYASAQGHDDVLVVLATAGAKLDLLDNDGEAPLDVAQGKKTKKLLQGLIDKADAEAEGDGDEGKDDDAEEA